MKNISKVSQAIYGIGIRERYTHLVPNLLLTRIALALCMKMMAQVRQFMAMP